MSKPIRVLHVLSNLKSGGAENFVMNVYREIDKNKVQFDFVKHNDKKDTFDDEINSYGGNIYACPTFNMVNTFHYKRWWDDFFGEHREYKILHAHTRTQAKQYLSIAKRNNLLTITHCHSSSNGKGIIGGVKDFLQKDVVNYSDYKFACSRDAGIWLFGEQVLQDKRFRIIHNGINIDRFHLDLCKREQIRSEHNISEETVVFGEVGNFTKPKNQRFLIDAFRQYCQIHSDCLLLLIGSGKLEGEIKELVRSYSLEDKVLFAGSVNNPEDYYNMMDVFLFPSLWEGLGIAAVEAQVSGLPCLFSPYIPDETVICKDLVRRVDLDSKVWASEMEKARSIKRLDRRQDINRAGYNSKTVAKQLEEFYLNISSV